MKKTIFDLQSTPIDDVEDAISKLYLNVNYAKHFNPYEKLDLYDIFFLVNNHKDKNKIQKIFYQFFIDYVKGMKDAMEEIVLSEDGGYRFDIYDEKYATELMGLARFYYNKDVDEEELQEISESYESFEAYYADHFWGNVICDMKNVLYEIAN